MKMVITFGYADKKICLIKETQTYCFILFNECVLSLCYKCILGKVERFNDAIIHKFRILSVSVWAASLPAYNVTPAKLAGACMNWLFGSKKD